MNFDECSSIRKLVFPSNIMMTDLRWLPAGVTIYGWENTGARDTAKAYDGKFVSRGTIPAVVAGPRVRKIVERYVLPGNDPRMRAVTRFIPAMKH